MCIRDRPSTVLHALIPLEPAKNISLYMYSGTSLLLPSRGDLLLLQQLVATRLPSNRQHKAHHLHSSSIRSYPCAMHVSLKKLWTKVLLASLIDTNSNKYAALIHCILFKHYRVIVPCWLMGNRMYKQCMNTEHRIDVSPLPSRKEWWPLQSAH